MCLEEGETSRTEQSALMAGVGLPGKEVLLMGRWERSDVAERNQ
jgi:hypothetical protein